MFGFRIDFNYPYLLLLIIPALALTLIPFFRIAKKYRRNRNRITSLVLHLLVMVLCISVLAGIHFSYNVYNAANEILLVVDASYSTEAEKDARDDYIRTLITLCNTDTYKMGIVTFGFDQVYAVPLTDDMTDVYERYLEAELPDVSATDISAALTFARGLFTNPEMGKIVLFTDGVETDEVGKASSAIKSLAADGIRVDTVYCSSFSPVYDVQVVAAELPDYNVVEEEKFNIVLTLKSVCEERTSVSVSLFDNDEPACEVKLELTEGMQTVTLEHSFSQKGLHALRFEVGAEKDEIVQNNVFYSYMYLEMYDKILVIESAPGQSEFLEGLLEAYDVTVIDTVGGTLPSTLDELREYDEIILNNIANSDLPEGFDKLLNEYVYEIGGGLFTVGGSEEGDQETAHAYNREDMSGTLYQQMLPVQAIDYTPPLGLAIVIDASGSMGMTSDNGVTRLDAAKNSAVSILKDETCLSERDYCGILTLSDSYTEETRMLPLTSQAALIDAVYGIESSGSTNFAPAIVRASMDLRALYMSGVIEKMHVIVISDGVASDYEKYMAAIGEYNALGVTFSFVAIDASESMMSQLNSAAELGGGSAIPSTASDLTIKLKNDIRIPEIKEVEYGEFIPVLNKDSYYASVITQEEMPALYGFYGTKARGDAEVVLSGQYGVPVYAQWKYGMGMVGSFMCDLQGSSWSADFVDSEAGKTFLISVINKLFPTQNIRNQDIEVRLTEENYITQMSIYTSSELSEDETIQVIVGNLSDENAEVSLTAPSAADEYSRSSFTAKEAGIYRILVRRLDGSGAEVSSRTLYKAFSYSAEYATSADTADRIQLMAELAKNGNGTASLLEEEDYWSVFGGFETSLKRETDPRIAFIITAIVLFLLDIAVRKFKFKWPHELIREYKEKKNEK